MGNRCECCGEAPSVEPLIAAADVLVIRALEVVGKRIVRDERSRFPRMAGRPFYEAHLLWQPDTEQVDAALASAWGTVPMVVDEYGCYGITSAQLTLILDRYTRELIRRMVGHSARELRFRLGVYVGAG